MRPEGSTFPRGGGVCGTRQKSCTLPSAKRCCAGCRTSIRSLCRLCRCRARHGLGKNWWSTRIPTGCAQLLLVRPADAGVSLPSDADARFPTELTRCNMTSPDEVASMRRMVYDRACYLAEQRRETHCLVFTAAQSILSFVTASMAKHHCQLETTQETSRSMCVFRHLDADAQHLGGALDHVTGTASWWQ